MKQNRRKPAGKIVNYNLTVGLIITLFMASAALLSQFWTPYSTTQMDSSAVNMAPCLLHPMGTDNFGRDVLSRVMNGSGITFITAVCSVGIGAFFGILIGAVTGYYGGILDEIVMGINNIILAFPSVLLALIFISLLGPGTENLIAALGILYIPGFARIVRSEFIRCRDLDFVRSARVMGVSSGRIIFFHILPNTAVSILTTAAVTFNNAVLSEAGLSYLGLGIQPPIPSLGRMLSEAQSYLMTAPWYALFPGIIIIVIILGFSMVGEGLRKMEN